MISLSKNKVLFIILVLMSFFIFSGCGEEEKPELPKKENTPVTPKQPTPTTNDTPKNDPPPVDEPKGNNNHPGLASDFKGETYIVKDGDNLNDLARYYYDSWEHWKDIFVANEGKIDDWNVIHPGLRLEIPPIK